VDNLGGVTSASTTVKGLIVETAAWKEKNGAKRTHPRNDKIIAAN